MAPRFWPLPGVRVEETDLGANCGGITVWNLRYPHKSAEQAGIRPDMYYLDGTSWLVIRVFWGAPTPLKLNKN